MTAILDDIAARRLADATLSTADTEALAGTYDIVSLGMLADELRRRRHGRTTTYLRVAQVPLASPADDLVWPSSAGELRVTAPFENIDAAVTAIGRLVARAGGVPLSAFSLADLEQRAGSSELAAWLRALAGAGLASLSEAPLDRLAAPAAALDAAASAGLCAGRLVLEAAVDGGPLGAIRLVQSLGRSVDAALALAPLVRRAGVETTGYADVKTMALARILLDVPHLQVDWSLHGPKLAQVALTFGADDVDNVSPLDEVAEGRRRAPLEEIRRNIRAASLDPVERDGRFKVAG